MKIVLNNSELSEIVKEWAEKKFNQNAELTIANKKNGIEVTVDLTDKTPVFANALPNVSEELVATGCCGDVKAEMYETSADEEAPLEAN